jgi:hypothetical protein
MGTRSAQLGADQSTWAATHGLQHATGGAIFRVASCAECESVMMFRAFEWLGYLSAKTTA